MLTEKMKMFCREYVKDFNASEAAIRAGYSKKTARNIGSENLTKPDIQNYIEKLKTKLINDKNKIIFENIQFWEEIRKNKKSKDSDRIRASENLGKYANMFIERIAIESIEIGKPPSLDDAEFPDED
jgi:phage terminase small subunit